MKRFLATTFILTGAMLAGGCATKKYVRTTTAPIQAKVDQVGEQANKQGQDIQENRSQIKQVDDKATSGISAAQERAQTADTHAGEAMTKANSAAELANQNTLAINKTDSSVQELRTTIANLDDYKMATEVTVPFKFNKYNLSNEAKQELDQMAGNLGKFKRYFIAVEGYTDKTGTAQYNDVLSKKRADSVVQYLVAKHDIPVYRIHMIGLGPEKPLDQGRTRAARAKNRRVEVKLFTADQGMNAQEGTQGSSQTMSQAQPTR